MVDRIIIQHDSRQVADAIRKRGERAVAAVDQAMGRGAHEIARDAVQTMPKFRSRTATATGVDHLAPLHWEVGFGTAYASYTERGTGAGGRPSLGEMLDWIRLKGITPRTPGTTPESLAFLIRRKIARKGVPAQPFAEPALRRNAPRLLDLMRGAARTAFADDRA